MINDNYKIIKEDETAWCLLCESEFTNSKTIKHCSHCGVVFDGEMTEEVLFNQLGGEDNVY